MTEAEPAPARWRFRDLPLFWRLLVPFMSLIVIMGFLGTLVIVRNLSQRAQDTLDQDLSRLSVEARTRLHDRELYLLESVNFAANIEGIAGAVRGRDRAAAERLLGSVLALKKDVGRLVVTDAAGRAVVEFERSAPGEPVRARPASDWSTEAVVAEVLGGRSATRSGGFSRRSGIAEMLVAAPICSQPPACVPLGASVAAMSLDRLAVEALGAQQRDQARLAVFDGGNRLLSLAGGDVPRPEGRIGNAGHQSTERIDGDETAVLYVPFTVGERAAGVLAVGKPVGPVFKSVRGAGFRLALIVFAGMVVVVVIGVVQSKRILRQIRPLVGASRELGKGNLAARADVIGGDELGELARRMNQMAEQLQASYETLESRVTQRTEEIERLLRERSEFFAAMSHEFRTPIAVILSQADMLHDAGAQPAVGDAAGTIRISGEQLLTLVNEILDLAESEVGGMSVDLEDVEIRQVLDEMRPTIDGLAAASELSVRYDLPRGLSPVHADHGRLKQIILNLVDNAAKYTPARGKIHIFAEAAGGAITLSVSDTGVGIPAGTGDLIFEPFYRVKANRPQRDRASSGLGLALAKRFAVAQGGRLEYSSTPGEGTTFTLTLPAGGADERPRRDRRKAPATADHS